MVISVASQKGGTGKTSTSVSLAAGLAHKGKHVLLIDYRLPGQLDTFYGGLCPPLGEPPPYVVVAGGEYPRVYPLDT